MDRESMKKLRLDRRLAHRRGWIRQADLEKEIEALPDVSSKIAPVDAEEADPADPDPEAPPTLQ